MSNSYRADIDGLRAIAVTSVVAYHAHIVRFNGGFIGVDIFFVISGYLITGIIQYDINNNNFSIIEFYKRRIHRIFPALFLLLFIVNMVAVLFLLPSELLSFARSLISSSLSVSNFQFFSESGYFDVVASTKPLLHTWSLAVEEQFYLLWPPLLIIAYRRNVSATLLCILMGALSLIVSIWLVSYNSSAAFYLLPSRAWELMLGGLISINPTKLTLNSPIRNVLATVGLIMILYPIHYYSVETPFPGLAAIIPCVGVALLLYCGEMGETYISRVLSSEPFRRIGLFSYSIYLWHWPIIIFFELVLYRQLTLMNQIYILTISLVVGALSYALIEEPFRRIRPKTLNSTSFTVAGAAILFVCCAGIWIIALKGFPERFTPTERQIASYLTYDGNAAYRGGKCFMFGKAGETFDAAACLNSKTKQPSMLLLGDSHAADLWPGLAAENHDTSLLQATFAGCKPLLFTKGTKECRRLMTSIFQEYLQIHHPDVVLISARWRKGDLSTLGQSLAYLKLHAGRVILVGPSPEYQFALPRLLVAAAQLNEPGFPDRHQTPGTWALDDAMSQIAAGAGVTYVSLRPILCSTTCKTFAAPATPMDFDYGHFTVEGSKFVVRGILAEILSH